MRVNLFENTHYRTYLLAKLSLPGARGIKAQMASAIGVQATYISQVLQEKSHLSLEQAEAASLFFKHNSQESHYFLLLVQKDRAGTKTLRTYFQTQLNEILKSRMVLTERLGKAQQLTNEDRSWYYASWIPAAAHIATTIPTLRTLPAMAQSLVISEEGLLEVLERLENIGLVIKKENEYFPGAQQIRLGNESHYIYKHHTNWRMQAVQSLERETLNELHYSAVVSLSQSDVLQIKNLLLESIKKNIDIVKESKEEELYCLSMDFFNILKKKT